MRNRSVRLLIGLLVVHALLLGWSAWVHSPTIDEIEWLPSGFAHWATGRLDIVVRNPPHVGLVAALPLLFVDIDTSMLHSGELFRTVAGDFFRANGDRVFWLFTLGRWACIPFSLVGAVTCFAWARELYGPRPGLLAAALWCFSPNILAHAQLVSHDVPAASLGLVAAYAFWRWLRLASGAHTLLAGLSLGVALLTKMTILIFLPLWVLVWIAWRVTGSESRAPDRRWLLEGAKLAAILVIAIDVLNLGYGFHGTFRRLDSFGFRSHALGGTVRVVGNRFKDSWLGAIRLPLPGPYVQGIDLQRVGLEGGWPVQASYLRGEWSVAGWSYYYVYALAIKVPLGAWCLLVLSALVRIRGIDGMRHGRDEMVLLAPALAVLLMASTSTVTDHLRYILPCFPAAMIWISRLADVTWAAHRWLFGMASCALAWFVASSLAVYPHSLSYFNELVGGPLHGHYHLVSSNIDYGQDLLMLRRWYQRHPEARPLGIADNFFWPVDPQVAGIEYFVAPSGPAPDEPLERSGADHFGPLPGWYAISVNALRADKWPARRTYEELPYYGYFLNFAPVAHAGYSIYVYHVTPDEANRVRAQMGLPPVDSAPRQPGE